MHNLAQSHNGYVNGKYAKFGLKIIVLPQKKNKINRYHAIQRHLIKWKIQWNSVILKHYVGFCISFKCDGSRHTVMKDFETHYMMACCLFAPSCYTQEQWLRVRRLRGFVDVGETEVKPHWGLKEEHHSVTCRNLLLWHMKILPECLKEMQVKVLTAEVSTGPVCCVKWIIFNEGGWVCTGLYCS